MPFISSIRKNYDIPDNTSDHFEITGGDEIYTAGGYKIHLFTQVGESNLTVTPRLPVNKMSLMPSTLDVEYLVIAGGGAGGSRHGSGGGGAGGYREGKLTLNTGNTPVDVGAGGLGEPFPGPGGQSGSPSTFGPIVSTGGGRGAGYFDYVASGGGSGGGGGGHQGGGGGGAGGDGRDSNRFGPTSRGPGSTSDPASGTTGQGNWGGTGHAGYPFGQGGNGGIGLTSAITGTSVLRAGGGGGAAWNPGLSWYGGGYGGGGGGGEGIGGVGTNGGDAVGNNNGSGGGGGNSNPSRGGSGSPGIVVVRYQV